MYKVKVNVNSAPICYSWSPELIEVQAINL